MALHARCNCGWSGNVSEMYGDARLHCPGCGGGLFAGATAPPPSPIPYGYKPYPTWQKRPVSPPRCHAAQWRCAQPTGSCGAFWGLVFGTLGLVLGTGAWGLGLVLGVAGLIAGANGFAAARARRRVPVLALIAVVMSIASVSVAVMARSDQRRHIPECHGVPQVEQQQARPSAPVPQPGCTRHVRPRQEAAPAPHTPRNEFEMRQVEYSENVRKARGQHSRD